MGGGERGEDYPEGPKVARIGLRGGGSNYRVHEPRKGAVNGERHRKS